MDEDAFWALTLAQLAALAERYRDEQKILDIRTARICAVLANIHRDKRKKARPFTEADFMPRGHMKRRVQTPDEQLSIVEGLNKLFGGTDLREET